MLGACYTGVEGEVSGYLSSSIQERKTPAINTPETNRKQQSNWRNTSSCCPGRKRGEVWGQNSCLGKHLEQCFGEVCGGI